VQGHTVNSLDTLEKQLGAALPDARAETHAG
jgi:hypothetical protein